MKSLGTFKSIATRLKKQIVEAKNVVVECEANYNGNPCTHTISALNTAEKKLEVLKQKLANATEMIEHYDFYQWCLEQEQEQAIGYETYCCSK